MDSQPFHLHTTTLNHIQISKKLVIKTPSPSLPNYNCKDRDRDVHLPLSISPPPQTLDIYLLDITSTTTCLMICILANMHQTIGILFKSPSYPTSPPTNEVSPLKTNWYFSICIPHNTTLIVNSTSTYLISIPKLASTTST